MKDSYDEFTMKAKFLKSFSEDWKIILGKNLVIKKLSCMISLPFMIGPKQRLGKK
jgi:hypothetical protein